MTFIQILLIAIAAFASAKAVLGFRRGQMPAAHMAAWLAFWLAVAAVVLRPEAASRLADLLGVGRGADVIVYVGLAASFYLLFKLFAKIESLERQLTKLVRALSLKDFDDDRHGKG